MPELTASVPVEHFIARGQTAFTVEGTGNDAQWGECSFCIEPWTSDVVSACKIVYTPDGYSTHLFHLSFREDPWTPALEEYNNYAESTVDFKSVSALTAEEVDADAIIPHPTKPATWIFNGDSLSKGTAIPQGRSGWHRCGGRDLESHVVNGSIDSVGVFNPAGNPCFQVRQYGPPPEISYYDVGNAGKPSDHNLDLPRCSIEITGLLIDSSAVVTLDFVDYYVFWNSVVGRPGVDAPKTRSQVLDAGWSLADPWEDNIVGWSVNYGGPIGRDSAAAGTVTSSEGIAFGTGYRIQKYIRESHSWTFNAGVLTHSVNLVHAETQIRTYQYWVDDATPSAISDIEDLIPWRADGEYPSSDPTVLQPSVTTNKAAYDASGQNWIGQYFWRDIAPVALTSVYPLPTATTAIVTGTFAVGYAATTDTPFAHVEYGPWRKDGIIDDDSFDETRLGYNSFWLNELSPPADPTIEVNLSDYAANPGTWTDEAFVDVLEIPVTVYPSGVESEGMDYSRWTDPAYSPWVYNLADYESFAGDYITYRSLVSGDGFLVNTNDPLEHAVTGYNTSGSKFYRRRVAG